MILGGLDSQVQPIPVRTLDVNADRRERRGEQPRGPLIVPKTLLELLGPDGLVFALGSELVRDLALRARLRGDAASVVLV
jgi:hypothetical protein